MSEDRSEPRSVRCLIVGSGPAGYTAAVYAARALLNPVLIQGIQPGGQLTITTDVENYPGFAEVIQGPWLMEQMQAQAEHVGTEIVNDIVLSADLSKRPFRLTTDSGQVWLAETLIIATGAQAKWLGLPSEQRFQGFGVSACATCDGFFYRGKEVVVVGGGNTAVEEALFLTSFASKVTIVHRRDEFRAERILQERLFHNPKIEVIWNNAIDEVVGAEDPMGVTGVRLKDVQTGETRLIPCDGVFIAIGHAPASELFKGQLEMDASGYLQVKAGTASTAVEGVYAAGDVTDDIYRQAVTAAGMGCMAALEAVRFLAEEDHRRAHHPISHHEAEKIGDLVAAMIRHARPTDHQAIRAVLAAAFGRGDEGQLVDRLRAEEDVMFELVAEHEGEVVGHVLFSRLWVDRRELYAALAPLAVRPDQQKTGLGSALVRAGLENGREFGCHGVLVLGDPAYYGRFGFSAEAARDVSAPFRGLAAFQALALEDRAFEGAISVAYPDAFAAS